MRNPDYWARVKQDMARKSMIRSFFDFQEGDLVRLDLMGTRFENVVTSDDQVIIGRLADPKLSYINVEYTEGIDLDQHDIEGKEIGLGFDAYMGPMPHGKIPVTLYKSFAAYRDAVYYFPSEIPEDSKYTLPLPEKSHRLLTRYGKVAVGDLVLFDVLNNQPQ
jgi:hypothetical protein